MDQISRALLMGGESGPPPGQIAYTSAGTYSWVVPDGVTTVSAVVVSSGQSGTMSYGGSGGDLRYINNLSVTPGETLTIVVGQGTNGTGQKNNSSISRSGTALISSSSSMTPPIYGGNGGSGAYGQGGPGGGAGGYSGNGGGPYSNGSGGGGGAGGYGTYVQTMEWAGSVSGTGAGGWGGGVGLRGQGANGTVGADAPGVALWEVGSPGGAGSATGATVGSSGGGGGTYYWGPDAQYGFAGQVYGSNANGSSGSGGVRIIWPSGSRMFPSTNTGDMS